MNRTTRCALTSLVLGVALSTVAFGQYTERMADSYGIGAEGTIGRGTDLLPGGPSDPRMHGRYSLFGPAADSIYGPLRGTYGGTTVYHARGYSYVAVPRFARAPYLTNRTYEPGDGYRYPLYYNPATGVYFYYPVKR